MKSLMTFDKAYNDLMKIVEQIEGDNIQLDTLAEKVNQANELIRYCESKLRNIEKDLQP